MSRIQRLPTSVVNKIAAGEVIERPASVVKELLENAVDAGATRIEVSLADGGLELIRVADNGCGIQADDLPLAVAPHATSKITDADDLFRVATLGFRGEALASISEVSQLKLRSRTADSDVGYELVVNGGVPEPPAPCGCPIGTVVEVGSLFFTTPVRQKFLRSLQTEMGHVVEAFTRIALAHRQIHMLLRHNDRVVHDLTAHGNWAQRIGAFFGEDIRQALIPIAGQDQHLELSGFVVDPVHSRSHNRMQYLFLNGRHIRERSLQHALSEAYRGLLLTGRYPIAFLSLSLPPDTVDVNVHPGKHEVRFLDSGRVYSLVLGSIRNKFLTTDLTARAQMAAPAAGVAADLVNPPDKSADVGSGLPIAARPMPAYQQRDIPLPAEMPLRDWTARPPDGPRPGEANWGGPAAFRPFPDPADQRRADPPMRLPPPKSERARALQIHNRYLIAESPDGLIVIDQHALHERIIYEQLREKVLAGKLETQKLLVPEPVPLSPTEFALIAEATETLAQIGIVVEPFGGTTMLVAAYPAMLANHNPAEMLRALLEPLAERGVRIDRREVLDELLHMIACKAAVKAGDRLTPAEIEALLDHRTLCQDAHHCPHGRPTALIFSRDELDRRFKRT
jgi:DNA mismatch repair protein MutL